MMDGEVMHIVIRTDASHEIGTGHVMRCLTLADALARKGAQVCFVCREHDGHLCDRIESRGHAVHRLPPPDEGFSAEEGLAHAAWLGASWQEDAEQTRSIIRDSGIKPDWLVVDHYGIDHRWERTLRPTVNRIFVIDDLADRNHDCDLLLDQNLVTDMRGRYKGKVPDHCRFVLGPEYALLQPIYAEMHERIHLRKGPIKHILVSFGGTDNDNLTGLTLSAIIGLNRPDIDVDVVIAETSKHIYEIKKLASGHDNIHLYGHQSTLVPLMADADLAIGAAGTTTWERLCLGLPSLVITSAESQRPIGYKLDQAGLIKMIGHKEEVAEDSIQLVLADLIGKGLDKTWSLNCHQAVDGKGANRLVSVLELISG